MKRFAAALILISAILLSAACLADEDWWLQIDGESYSIGQLNAGASGPGWSWSKEDQALVLAGFNGKEVGSYYYSERFTIKLAPGFVNNVEGGVFAESENFRIEGAKDAVLNAKYVYSQRFLTMESCEINTDGGGIFSGYKQVVNDCRISVKNCDYALGSSYGVHITRSDVEADSCKRMISGQTGIFAVDSNFSASNVSEYVAVSEGGSGANDGISMTGCTVTARDCKAGFFSSGSPCALEGCKIDMRLDGSGILASYDLTLSKCDVNIRCYGSTALSGGRIVRFTGGNSVTLSSDDRGIGANEALEISGSDYLDVTSGKEAIQIRYGSVNTITIGAETVEFPKDYNHITIDAGRIVSYDNSMFGLVIGGKRVPDDDLKKPLSGPGWTWDPDGRVLSLTDYSSGDISFFADKVTLAISGENTVGEMSIDADVTVKGDGALNGGHKFTCNALTLKSGRFVFPFIEALKGAARVEGGYMESSQPYGRTFMQSGGEIKIPWGFQGLSARDKMTFSGGKLDARANITCYGDIEITGGEIVSDSTMLTENNGNISVTGGTVSMDCEQKAIFAQGNITIGGTANCVILSQSAALTGKKVTIGGVPFKGIDSVEIQNGRLVRSFSRVPSIEIDAQAIYSDQISKDCQGEGWRWTAKSKTLTLSGDGIDMINVNIPGVTLSPDGAFGSEKHFPTVQTEHRVTLKGPGTMYVCMNTSAAYAITSGIHAHIEKLYSWMGVKNSITITKSVVYTKSVDTADSIVVKNSSLFVDGSICVADKNMTVSSSLVVARANSQDSADISVDGRLSVKNSILIFSNDVSFGRGSVKGTAIFKREMIEDTELTVLVKSAKTKFKATLPKGIYYIPSGVVLNAKKELTIPGSLIVDGQIKGKVNCPDIISRAADIKGEKTVVEKNFVEIG